MNARKKLERLGDHFRVPKGSMSYPQWSAAIKKTANATADSIDVLYDRTFAKSSPPPTIEVKAIEVKPPEPVEKPSAGDVKVEGAAQRVDVQAPVINVNIPAPNLTVNQAAATAAEALKWLPIVHRLGVSGFVLFCGVLLGLLVAKKVLPMVGLS